MFIMNGVHGSGNGFLFVHESGTLVLCLHMVVGDVNVLCFCGTLVLGLVG